MDVFVRFCRSQNERFSRITFNCDIQKMNVLGGKHRIVTFKNILNLDVRFLLLHCRISGPTGTKTVLHIASKSTTTPTTPTTAPTLHTSQILRFPNPPSATMHCIRFSIAYVPPTVAINAGFLCSCANSAPKCPELIFLELSP